MMSTASNDQGRAYEYAWICVLEDELEQHHDVKVIDNSSLEANKKAWDSMSVEKQEMYSLSAKSAVYQLIDLEPLMAEESDDELTLAFQSDGAGTQGDVRDIVVRRDAVDWEIGFSIKHNHEAIKHSRLSHRLDFGKEWFDIPCSEEYWSAVKPLFDWLKEEKAKGTKWPDIADKDSKVYVPLLNAFMDEVGRAYSIDKDVPRKMVEYLIGKCDYYKVISHDAKAKTVVKPFNLHKTLGSPDGHSSSTKVPSTELPSALHSLNFKEGSSNTVVMILDKGWQLSFRIHNASSKVEPSLKFDVQFISMPESITTYECVWLDS